MVCSSSRQPPRTGQALASSADSEGAAVGEEALETLNLLVSSFVDQIWHLGLNHRYYSSPCALTNKRLSPPIRSHYN